MKRLLSRLGCWFLAVVSSPLLTAALHDITVNSTVGTSNVVQMRLYVPDGVPVIRGILLYGNGAGGDDRSKANRAHYQAFADNIGFAIVATAKMDRYMRSAAEIGSNYNTWAPPGGGGDGRRLLEGLGQLATVSGHPELLNAPVVFWGFSGAGQMAYEYNAWKPERTIAFSLNKGGFYTTEVCSEDARKTPSIFISDEIDPNTSRRAHIQEVYLENKTPGASWAYLMEQGLGHQEGAADHVLLPFFHNLIKLRYPAGQTPVDGPVTLKEVPFAAGWLADQTTWQTPNGMTAIAPLPDYAGDPVNPSWLPDKDSAFLFRALSSFNRPLSLATATGAQAFAAGAEVKLVCNVSGFAEWTKLEFYNGGTKLGEVVAGAAPELTLTNLPPAVYGFVVLGHKADGTVRTSNPFAVVMRGGPGGADPIDVWKHGHFGLQAGDPRISADDADPDQDGVSNLQEFQNGTDPYEGVGPEPDPEYDHVIPLTQGTVDGAVMGIEAGDVIGIEAGVRGRLAFVNLRGTAELPIVIKNKGGLVSLSSGTADEAIRIGNSEFFELRGDGVPGLKYGFEITKATGTGLQITDKSTNFTVCFLHIHDCGYAGIMSKSDPRCDGSTNRGNFTQRDVRFHDNYIHDVQGEGMYLGSSFYTGTDDVGSCVGTMLFPHDIIGMRVYNNLTERTGREGIQVGCVIEDCEIYGNAVRSSGTRNEGGQNNGIQINPGTTGLLYSNTLVGVSANGIALTGLGNNTVFNNVIANVGGHGLFCDDRNNTADPSIGTIPGSFIRVHNNTIVNAGQFGFRTYNERSVHEFRNNLVVNAALGLVHFPNVTLTQSNNLLTTSASNPGFVDATAHDYRLTTASPARDAGADVSAQGVTFDLEGLPRPFGAAFDIGAHEAGGLSVRLTSTPPTGPGLADGTATASVIGGTAPYTYAWSHGGTTAQATGLSAGMHTITVTDAGGATKAVSVTLIDPPPVVPIAVKARILPELADANDGSIRLTISGGVAPFTTTWAHGATGINPIGLTAGYYTYTVTDAAGTVVTDTLYVRDAGTPIYRVNTGGNAESDRVLGWAVDKEDSPSAYLASNGSLTTGSSTWSATNNFTDAPANLLGNRRYINASGQPLRYAFPVEPGYYEVNLYFNEVMTTYVVGSRVFDVLLENTVVIDDLDMVAAHGIDRPARYGFVRQITDGFVDVGLNRNIGSAMISGIAIHRLAGPPSQVARVSVTSATVGYDGSPKAVGAATYPADLALSLTYNGNPGAPSAAGVYEVVATITQPGYTGSAAGTLTILPAEASVTLGGLTHTYDGSPKPAAATTSPAGLAVNFSYEGEAAPPINAGSYAVTGIVADSNFEGGATGVLTIAKAPALVELGLLSQVYDGTPKAATATTTPAGLAVDLSYSGSATAPVAAGSHPVAGAVNDANYHGYATGTLVIGKAPATVTLGNLRQYYDGTPRAVTTETTPEGLAVDLTYDSETTAPIYPGTYAVAATVNDANHQGVGAGSLQVTTTAVVRHAPAFNAMVAGSVQVLLPESVTLNGSAAIAGDLLVPGTPQVRLNGQPVFSGTQAATGAAAPTSHFVTLNSGAMLRYLVRQVDPVAMPTVLAPATPAGTRNVALNQPGQSPGDFATLRNLTLNSNAGRVAVPPGTYGSFVVNGASVLVLGVAGATAPAAYQLQGLTLNSSARIQLAGPVTLTLASGVTLNGSVNVGGDPAWLALRVAAGGVTLNSGVTVAGHLVALSGTVTLNSSEVLGSIVADRLVLNGNAVLTEQ